MKKLIDFIRTSWLELKKVTWPGKKEILASTVVVILVGFFLMVYIGVVDFGLSKAVKFIFR
ncbi:MAG TPA: preprotein translocase subunit SecE [Firmicutes bacterium]|nr:preprotein translocase subunit SecE [Bacillota bacterium]